MTLLDRINAATAVHTPVHNRGVAPSDFFERLITWVRQADAEIFGGSYRSTTEPDLYQTAAASGFVLPPLFDSITYRKAFMCEVLRVLGGFESSWNWDEGVDLANPDSDTLSEYEAGVFQCSANSMNFDSSLKECFRRGYYGPDGGEHPNASVNEVARRFISLTKSSPNFALEYCARLLRFTIRHHGPIRDRHLWPWVSPEAVEEFYDLIYYPDTNPTPPMPTPTKALNNYILDPGHGGDDSGAVSSGAMEKNVCLDVATRLLKLMRADTRFKPPTMTRHTDEFITLEKRAAMANSEGASLISIHANSSNGLGYGFEVYTTPGQTQSDKLATALYNAYQAEMTELKGRPDTGDGDPDKEARFAVLTQTINPAVLFELAFIDREADRLLLTSPTARQRMALAFYKGILAYEGLPYQGEVVPPPAEPTIDYETVVVCAKWLEEGALALEGTVFGPLDQDGKYDPTKDLPALIEADKLSTAAEWLLERAKKERDGQ